MNEFLKLFTDFNIAGELWNTLLMSFGSIIIAYLIGVPLGIWTVTSSSNGIKPNKVVNGILNVLINFGRSIPFIIMVCLLSGFTFFLIGTSIGPVAAIVPLSISAIPFVARLVEQSLKEIDQGVIDASICMGATNFQVITKVYLVETIPSLIRGLAIASITIIGYTAMAGAVGGRGLGYLAVNQGYQRNNNELMYLCVVIIIVLVNAIQLIIEYIAKRIDKK